MAKETFLNLPEEKRQAFIRAFMEEFSRNGFEQASITLVVKELGIAKGSVYQYFENKLDLFLYLKQQAEATKIRYVMQVATRDQHPNFWEYYRAMFRQGVRFDLECGLESKFLYRIGKSEHSPALANYMAEWKRQAMEVFTAMIRTEIEAGNFRSDVRLDVMAQFLVTASLSIEDLLRDHFGVDFDQNLAQGKALFADDQAALFDALDAIILLLQRAFDINSNDDLGQ